MTVGQACGARDDAHHLRGQATEIFACLLVRDLVELAELPLAGEACSLGLQVGRRVAGQTCGLIRLRIGQPRVEVVVDEQAPHVVVGVVADELLDVDAAVAKRAAFPVGLGDLRLDGDDALETRLEGRWCCSSRFLQLDLPTDRPFPCRREHQGRSGSVLDGHAD